MTAVVRDDLRSRITALAAAAPDAAAVVDAHGGWTYRELSEAAAALASALVEAGARTGQVVSLQLPNERSFVAAHVAVEGLTMVTHPMLMQYQGTQLEGIVRSARPAVVCTVAEYRGRNVAREWARIAAVTGYPRIVVILAAGAVDHVEHTGATGEPRRFEGDRQQVPAVLIYTSGTVVAKGMVHGLGSLEYGVTEMSAIFGLGPGTRIWMPSPISHGTGLEWGVRMSGWTGATLVLQDRWNADDALDLLDRWPSDYTMGSGTFIHDLVLAAERANRSVALRRFVAAGAPLPPALVERAARTGLEVLPAFGMTEHFVSLLVRPTDPPRWRGSSDGRALPGTEVGVRLDDGIVSTRPGDIGELAVRGACVGLGYLDAPELTEETFRPDGWQLTGDVAALLDDGYVRIVGRHKDMIIRGGLNIAPRTVEDALVALPAVAEAAVVGSPDDRLGERICAVVVPADAACPPALAALNEALLAGGLPRFMLPERLVVRTELPKTASGKVRKDVLRDILAATTARDEGEH